MTIYETLTTIWDGVLRQIPLFPDLWQPSPPQDGLLLPINGYKQTQSYTCGAVSGFAVAEYFRPALRFDTFCRRVNPDPIWGTSLRPRITIRMQTHAGNSEALAPIPEPCRPGRRRELRPGRKQRAALGQALQNGRNLLVKAENSRRAGLAPLIGDELILPVHIFG